MYERRAPLYPGRRGWGRRGGEGRGGGDERLLTQPHQMTPTWLSLLPPGPSPHPSCTKPTRQLTAWRTHVKGEGMGEGGEEWDRDGDAAWRCSKLWQLTERASVKICEGNRRGERGRCVACQVVDRRDTACAIRDWMGLR